MLVAAGQTSTLELGLFWGGLLLLAVAVGLWLRTVPGAQRASRALRAAPLAVAVLGLGSCGAAVTIGNGSSGFCDKHDCISNFDNGHGSIVQCADGMWSHSGGLPGACSDHGGER